MRRWIVTVTVLLLVFSCAVGGPAVARASALAANPTADLATTQSTILTNTPVATQSTAQSTIEFTTESATECTIQSPLACRETNIWGVCFDTLPKLHCCSAAFLGWSQIVVGDRFPVAGTMMQGEPYESATALQITFPSGRTERIPVRPDGRFSGVVTFDEEGYYVLARVSGDSVEGFGDFQVGYRAELLEVPTVEAQFGQHHSRSGVTMGAVEAGRPAELQIRFTDAAGEPVRNRTLAIGRGEQRYTTDADGIARVTYTPYDEGSGYAIERLYPGLGILTYRTVTVDDEGVAHGLPGGPVAGFRQGDRTYLPLRAFLEKADPLRFDPELGQILWNEEARSVWVAGLSIMIDTGLVTGRNDFRADLQVVDGTTYLELDSLIRLMDILGAARRTGESGFILTMAQEP